MLPALPPVCAEEKEVEKKKKKYKKKEEEEEEEEEEEKEPKAGELDKDNRRGRQRGSQSQKNVLLFSLCLLTFGFACSRGPDSAVETVHRERLLQFSRKTTSRKRSTGVD